ISGSGFGPGSVAQWNGSALTTTFVSATQLTASVPTTLITAPGTVTVTVLFGGVTSNRASFTVMPPNPVITSLNPSTVTVGSGAFTLSINGTGFVPGAIAQMGNTTLPTTFVSTTQLTSLVPANLVSSVGSLLVEVRNPGGGNS